MGFGDLAGSALDMASGALAGDGAAPKPDTATPEFTAADPLDPVKEKKPLAVGPNSADTPPNTAKPPDVIEFIHYGHVHADTTNHFPHPKFDNEKDKKPSGRGIMFRDALERESTLLYGFVSSAKTVHEELKKSRGVAGAVAGALGKLIGGSSTEPDPASFKFLLDDITKAGGTINDEKVEYLKVHKAGIDFHQTRADYTEYCTKKLDPFYLHPSDAGKPTLMALPSIAGGAKKVFDILFKAYDIYFGIFLSVRSNYEPLIEDACYKFSLDTVKKYQPHTFAPWYPLPKDAPAAAEKSTLPGALGGAADDINKAKTDVTDALGAPDDDKDAPGESTINDLFDIFGKGPKKPDPDAKDPPAEEKPAPAKDPADKKPDPIPADKVVNAAFADVLGFSDGMPSPLDTIIGKVVWGNVEFLKAVYAHLCKDGTKKIDRDWLNSTAHDMLFDKLYGFLYDTFSFLTDIKKKTMTVQGQALGPEKLIDKGQDALKQKFGPYADSVIGLLAKDLAAKLEALRSPAADNKAVTMEIYLGALPYLFSLQVRNTIFPLWDLVFTDLVGKGNTVLDTVMKPIKGMIGDARNYVDDAKDKKDRISAAKDKFDKEGMALGSGGQNLTGYKDILFGDKPKPGADASSTGGSFPNGPRKTAGVGSKIGGDDPETAKKDHKGKWPG